MPVSVAYEASTTITTALRESLNNNYSGNVITNGENAKSEIDSPVGNPDGITEDESVHNRLATTANHVLVSEVDYEEITGYSQSFLDTLKSKYVVVKPGALIEGNNHEAENGFNSNFNNNNVRTKADSNGNAANNSITSGTSNKIIKRQTANPTELPEPNRILYPRENIRLGWKCSGRKWQVGVGMLNVGNTCYLNSTLQALFHVPAMANWLLSEEVQHMPQCDSMDSCIICGMIKTLEASQHNQSAIRPYLVYSKLKFICKHLVMGRQEDAHEFLRYLVEAMEKSYLMRFKNYKELDQFSKETTPLNQILGGYLKSAVRCLSCGHVSVTFQHFEDLLLDIRKAETIDEALDGYFSRERLEDMGYKCESCRKKVSATKQFSLERAPIVLCIQLKRFSVMGSKLNKLIAIKPTIDLAKYVSRKPNGEQLTYRLVAMVTHLGVSQHCGHYTAIGLTESGTYYNYDDSYVRPISLQGVCNTNAYIIFYEMDTCTPRSSGIVNTKRANDIYTRVNGCEANGTAIRNSDNNSQNMIGPQLPPNSVHNHPKPQGNSPSTSNELNVYNTNQMSQAVKSPKTFHNSKTVFQYKNGSPKCNSFYTKINSPTQPSGVKKESMPQILTDKNLSTTNSKITDNGYANNVPLNETVGNQSSNNSNFSDCKNSTVSQDCLTSQATLPSMPTLLFDGKSVEPEITNCNVTTSDSIEYKSDSMLKQTSVANLKSLVPYESETDEEVPVVDTNCIKNTVETHTNNSSELFKGYTSDTGNDVVKLGNSNNDDTTLQSNIAPQENQAVDPSLVYLKNLNNNLSINTSPEKCCKIKQKDGSIQKKFKNSLVQRNENNKSSAQVNGFTGGNSENHVNNDLLAVTTSNIPHTPFKRSHSTPPSPPAIKTKTGLWQVTTLQPLTGLISPTEHKQKPYTNPFSNNVVENGCKRRKLNSNGDTGEQNNFVGNGYQNNTEKDNTTSELSKQSHRGYGLSVPSWADRQTEVEKEIIKEASDQLQQEHNDQEENDVDRGRLKKVRIYSGNAERHNHASAYNPFQEQENRQRWKRFSGGHVRRQFQRNKFKFQRNNYRYQRMTAGSYTCNNQNNHSYRRNI